MIIPTPKRLFLVVLLGVFGVLGPSEASAEIEFPKRSIKLVVPFPPGGGSDTAGRLLKRALAESGAFDQPFVILNVPGGGGTIGSRKVKNSTPDGHTLLLLHEGIFTARQSGQATYGAEAFKPVAAFGRTGTVLAVSDTSPLGSLADLISHCQENPDTLTFACNLGAPAHFVGLQIQKAAGDIRFRFVSSGGGAKRYGDLIGGEVEATIFSVSEFVAFQGGGIRALAYLGSERHPAFPDIPTAIEQGIPVETSNLQFVWAPANTPDTITARIGGEIVRALSSPESISAFEKIHLDPTVLTGEALAATIRAQRDAIETASASDPNFSDTRVFGGFPLLIICSCATLLAFLLVSRWAHRAESPSATSSSNDSSRQFAFVAAIVAYLVAFSIDAPFVVTTIVFTFISSCILVDLAAVRKRVMTGFVAFAFCLGLGCYYVFTQIFSIDLP